MASKSRVPWWAFFLAAPFVLNLAFNAYMEFFAYGPAGFSAANLTGKMVIQEVRSGTPAFEAGLRSGDALVAVDGQPIHRADDWFAVRAQFEPEKPILLTVQRDGQPLQLSMTLSRRHSWETLSRNELLQRGVGLGVAVIYLALGLLVLFSRPRDRTAVAGAVVLLTVGVVMGTFGPPGYSYAVVFRRMPIVLQALSFSFVLTGPYLLVLFFGFFPRPVFRRRWVVPALVLPWFLLGLPFEFIHSYHLIYTPAHVTGTVPGWAITLSRSLGLVYGVGALLIFAIGFRRLEDTNERRRVRLIFYAALISFGTLLGFFAAIFLAPPSFFFALFTNPASIFFLMFCWALFPVAFAYALLRHRLFDVRLIIRQGLQYAFARGVLVLLVPAALGLLVLDMALHRNQTIGAILSQRGWLYILVGGLAYVAQQKRRRWLDSLDRRFFRERYNAQQLLREIVEEIRSAESFEAQAPRVVARIEAALHPEFVALLVRSPQEGFYRALACAPAGMSPPAIGADSKLMSLLRVLGKPIQVSLAESGWLKQQLPASETQFLRETRLDLLVPIAVSPEVAEAVLAMGVKRSEEPYAQEDEQLLLAIASALALLMERPAPRRAIARFEECPQCGVVYDSGVMQCPSDGAALASSALVRTLAGRYRLDFRLGRGGMGTVYRGLDTALERDVAVKLIREELVGNPDAAQRFRREAKAAAQFSHPNLVAVYDFGVEAGSRAFLVMELLVGSTLRQELQSKQRLNAPQMLEILRGVCAAVEAAHQRGLVHRDLKAENIFLSRSGSTEIAKVLDFGLAKFIVLPTGATLDTADTGAGVLLGTPRYMPPEQLHGGEVDKGWDLWALAIVAYEMITGSHPFEGTTVAECQNAILSGRFVAVRERVPDASPELDSFIASSLALDRQQRPASAASFFAQLQAAIGSARAAGTAS